MMMKPLSGSLSILQAALVVEEIKRHRLERSVRQIRQICYWLSVLLIISLQRGRVSESQQE